MSEKEVTAYIDAQPEPKRTTLTAVRATILDIEPALEQVIAWKSPAFTLNRKYVVGLCAFKNHLTFSPQSADVMAAHTDELSGFVTSASSFQFPVDSPLPKSLVESLVRARLREIV